MMLKYIPINIILLLCNVPMLSAADDLALCRSDLNRNGEVDIWDVFEIAAVFGITDKYDALVDLNDDGAIDIWDVAFLAQYFGQPTPANRLLRFDVFSDEDSLRLTDNILYTETDTLPTWTDRDGRMAAIVMGANNRHMYLGHTAYQTHYFWYASPLPDDTLQVNLRNDYAFNTARITVDASSLLGTVSPYLTGFNTLFCHVTDSIRAEGRLTGYLRDVRSGILRYPGGEVSSQYHWELPGYGGWQDAIRLGNPNLDPALAPDNPANMDTDEYIAFCREVGAEPMIGVNMESWVRADRVEEGIAEAVRWVQYCKDREYNVKYWFMDNESYHTGTYHLLTVQEYADLISRYVPAMRAVNPDIQVIINWKSKPSKAARWADYEYLLLHAGDHWDIADIHQYWTWGTASYEKWLTQNPMHHTDNKLSYAEETRWFHDKMRELGYDKKLASLEWNRGPNDDVTDSPFQVAMIQAEMLHQFIQGGMHMATMWPLNWTSDQNNRSFVHYQTLEPLVSYDVFKLYAAALGGEQVACTTDQDNVPALAVKNTAGDSLHVYVLHKSEPDELLRLRLQVEGFEFDAMSTVSITASDLAASQAEYEYPTLQLDKQAGLHHGNLPHHSLTRITLTAAQ